MRRPTARIDGHRISVEDVALWHQRFGMIPDGVASAYPSLALSEVHAALADHFENREAIDADIREGRTFVQGLRAAQPSILE